MSGIFDPVVFDESTFDAVFVRDGPPDAVTPAPSWIEAWVTDQAGNYIAHLERSEASPFRHFGIGAEIDGPGTGSLEYQLDNDIVRAHDDLFAYGNLVWMRYRGKTRAWIVEQRHFSFDVNEHASDWVQVSGRGVRQLLADRTIWPTNYGDANSDPSVWGLGGWETKTNATATVGTRVVPVASTTAGLGATVGDPVEIVGGPNRQIGIIESIVAGVSVTLVDPLAYTFPSGSRVRGAASQWRRFVNRAAGEMLWDIIAESNPRFVAEGGPPILRGTVETTGSDGWTQDFRFDNAFDVMTAVTNRYGDVEMDGLTFNFYAAMGVDRTSSVILEEGADILKLDVQDNDRDSLSWVVAEGTGHAVFSFLAPKQILTRAQRKTAAKRAAVTHRKAPAAPRKVIEVKADYPLDFADEAVAVRRRREAYIDAKDISDPAQLDALTDAVLDEHQVTEAVALTLSETRFRVDEDYGLGDWIQAFVPSRGFHEDVRVVAISFEEKDDPEKVDVTIDVNDRRSQGIIDLQKGLVDTRASVGVQNRQPPGTPTLSYISDTVYFDTATASVTSLFISDRVYRTVDCRLAIDFDQYPMPVSAAATSGSLTSDSGGGATSGSGGSTTSAAGGAHDHSAALWASSTPGVYSKSRWSGLTSAGGAFNLNIESDIAGPDGLYTSLTSDHTHTIGGHTHTTPNHQHTVPGHTHSLTAAATKEAYPASHSVTLKVYELVDTTWALRGTIAGLTNDVEDIDLTPYIVGPGRWRIVLQSAAAQPNGGRIGAHLSGFLYGAILSV